MTSTFEVWTKSEGRTATLYRHGNTYYMVANEYGEKYTVTGQTLKGYRDDLKKSGYIRTDW
jgi:hypothetical protein